MIVSRPFWHKRVEDSWQAAPLVWLAGVRRAGKTTLVRNLDSKGTLYLNCDLPAVEEVVRDPELFFRNVEQPTVVFDEVHQLKDPSRVLKIGVDMFPHLRIVATGSSTLAASRKFSDSLTGRKRVVRLLPILFDELESFGVTLAGRLYRGGLPQAAMASSKEPAFYREWLDSFFARDIQRLFEFRSIEKFNNTFEYLLRQSGGLLDVSKTASALGISRPTVEHHLRALEITQGITVIRPFFGGGRKELVKSCRCYGFDSGFVAFCKGWDPPRPDDFGKLWEHLVLEYLQAHNPNTEIQFWRDTDGREIDFVLRRAHNEVDAIECKWDPSEFETVGLKAFRSHYPNGRNFLISPVHAPSHQRKFGDLEVWVCDPAGWRVLAHRDKGS